MAGFGWPPRNVLNLEQIFSQVASFSNLCEMFSIFAKCFKTLASFCLETGPCLYLQGSHAQFTV
jgi:hypothetical protein